MFWRKVERKIGVSFETLLEQIRNLPPRTPWRWAQAGDLPGQNQEIDREAMRALTAANKRRPVIAFTHKPVDYGDNLEAIKEATENGFHINLSADNLTHADELADTGMSVVSVIPSEYARNKKKESISEWKARVNKLPKHTPAGRRIAICPATYKDVSCMECMACSTPRKSGAIIGFPAHGNRKTLIDKRFNE